ncbi:MAG TPA: polyprenol monophosphomannose synthase [Anaerolineales bacterium]|nr:polyprenol monophosphomannose synthase [Anaerolineales bacterium]
MPDPPVTIVIPTYNEAENLSRLISALLILELPGLRVLVVDDNSPDGTGEIANGLVEAHPDQVSAVHRPGKGGLGPAYLHGFGIALERGAAAVGQMDADFSHPPEKWPELAAAAEQSDLVIGSRYVPGGSVDRDWPFWRKGLSAFGNMYARSILGLPVRDVTGGFRLYRRELLEGMPLDRVRSNGYVFQVEMAYLARLCGARVQEVPIYFADRRWGTSKMSLRIQLEAALRVWQVKFEYRDLEG